MTKIKVNIDAPYKRSFARVDIGTFYIYGGDLWLKTASDGAFKVESGTMVNWIGDTNDSELVTPCKKVEINVIE